MVVPHVADPADLPAGYYRGQSRTNEVKNIPIDPNGWNMITDAMARVLLPEGTAPVGAHSRELTSRARRVQRRWSSLAHRAKHRNDEALTSERLVCGIHAAAQSRHRSLRACSKAANTDNWRHALATQVIKAYVDKQRRQPTKLAEKPASKVEIGAVWTIADAEMAKEKGCKAGRFVLNVAKKLLPLATAAPGLQMKWSVASG